MLLDAAEKLIGVQFVFSGSGAAQKPHVEHDHVAPARFDAVQHVPQVIERVVIADRDEDIAGARTHSLGR